MDKKSRKRSGIRIVNEPYLHRVKDDFTTSFKELNKRFIAVLLLDVALVAVIFLGLIVLWKLIIKKLSYIPPMPIFNPEITPASELKSYYATIISISKASIAYLILFIIIVFIIWTLIKSLQWRIILRKKLNFRFYLKSITLNAIWQIAWILIFVANFLLLNPKIAKFIGILLLVIYLHLSYIKYMQIAKTKRIFGSIKDTLRIGILRFYLYLIPYFLMVIVLLLVLQLYYIYLYLPENIQIAIFGLIVIVWVGWARFYVARIIE